MKMYKTPFRALALLFVVGMALAVPASAHAQQIKKCFTNEAIISLVKGKKITSFAKIEHKLRLQEGTKLFGQKLCAVGNRYVYFFKVVDSSGRTKKFALYADDGSPYVAS